MVENNIEIIGNVKISNSQFGENCRAFEGARIVNSQFENGVSIGNDTDIVNCKFGNNIAINRRCYVNDSSISDYSYVGLNSTINYAEIGRFCSIGQDVRIGGANHDYNKVTTFPKWRFEQLFAHCRTVNLDQELDDCKIGNDVWIAANATILRGVKIADGAVIAAGAVVTKDVEPYTIVAGIPAKPLKKRFEQKYIDKLLEIKWWNWNLNLIEENIELITSSDMNDETIDKLQKIAKRIG